MKEGPTRRLRALDQRLLHAYRAIELGLFRGHWLRREYLLQHPRALISSSLIILVLGLFAILRTNVYFSAYGGRTYTVPQVAGENGFVAWEGEQTAVRGRVASAVGYPACDGQQAILLMDVRRRYPRGLEVLFRPQPEWLHRILSLPVISGLIPPGLPPNPKGIWTIKGHLSVDTQQNCGLPPDYVLHADPWQ